MLSYIKKVFLLPEVKFRFSILVYWSSLKKYCTQITKYEDNVFLMFFNLIIYNFNCHKISDKL